MARTVTVPCPHCGATGTHQVEVESGRAPANCRTCGKAFTIYLDRGDIKEVRAS